MKRFDIVEFSAKAGTLSTESIQRAFDAAAGGDGYCYVYSPMGMPFTVELSEVGDLRGVLRAIWFDPRTGEERLFGIYPTHGRNLFVPPSCGKSGDWALILECVKKKTLRRFAAGGMDNESGCTVYLV